MYEIKTYITILKCEATYNDNKKVTTPWYPDVPIYYVLLFITHPEIINSYLPISFIKLMGKSSRYPHCPFVNDIVQCLFLLKLLI